MTRAALFALSLLTLAACGVDGEPSRPDDALRPDRSGTVGLSGSV